jgi:hypothetical protein
VVQSKSAQDESFHPKYLEDAHIPEESEEFSVSTRIFSKFFQGRTNKVVSTFSHQALQKLTALQK